MIDVESPPNVDLQGDNFVLSFFLPPIILVKIIYITNQNVIDLESPL